jgi:hypothetical protein
VLAVLRRLDRRIMVPNSLVSRGASDPRARFRRLGGEVWLPFGWDPYFPEGSFQGWKLRRDCGCAGDVRVSKMFPAFVT